eukprot:7333959-Prymnesium_polylepis.1
MLTPSDDTCARSPSPHAGAEGCRLCEGAGPGRAHQQKGDGARGAAGRRRRRARAARGRPVQGP